MSTILAIPDTHVPFEHQDLIPFLSSVKQSYKPDYVVHLGDVADQHFASRFDKHSENWAKKELEDGRKVIGKLAKVFPTVSVCMGNHDLRVSDRIREKGLPPSIHKTPSEFLETPAGWTWDHEFEIDGIVFEHGQQYSGKDAHIKAAAANMACTVIGHVHSYAGINYVANRRHLVWGFNVGCLINHRAYAFEYGAKGNKPIIGCGIIEDGIPRFVPMQLNKHGRWRGEL